MGALTTTVSLAQFIDTFKITMTAERTDRNPAMDDSTNMDHWRVTLRRAGKRMSLVFLMGYGHQGAEPKLPEVLDCLASDASSVENNDFESWAADMGFDTDSRKAKRTFDACSRQMRKLDAFLGPDAYNQLVWHTERE